MKNEIDLWDQLLWSTEPNRSKESEVWQLYHENSKVGRYDFFPSKESVLQKMSELSQTLKFDRYPKISLTKKFCDLALNLSEAIMERRTPSVMKASPLSLQQISTILYYTYGITKENQETKRNFRAVPSAGGLYPLDLFLFSMPENELKMGLYHYNPLEHQLSFLVEGDLRKEMFSCLVFQDIPVTSSLIIFIVAHFERTVFKYSNRGYRFAFLEAGHVGQNLDLVSAALGLSAQNIGGYYDREIDELLDLDGISQSTIYMAAIGKNDN